MTQIRAFAKRLKIDLRDVEVRAKLHWEGEQEGDEPYVTNPVGFGLDVTLDTDASARDQHRLLDAAKKGCFLEQTLAKGLIVDHRLRIGEAWEDA